MNKHKDILLQATEGLAGTAINGVLWWLYMSGASFGKSKTSRGAYQAFREADKALEEFNYENFKQILKGLQNSGLIERRIHYSNLEITITQLGKERIHSLFPQYQKDRPWDGYLYLVSYDIPETKHASRNLLRQYLKQVGCALLQESLWVTPYNPRKLLNEFMQMHNIEGTILISKLGHDGAIGEETLAVLVERIYKLQEINDKYQSFLDDARQKQFSQFQLVVKYQGILKDDPQLPFALLPSWWVGEKANKVYLEYIK